MRQIALVLLMAMCLCGAPAARAQATAQQAGAAAVFSATPVKGAFMQGEAVELQLQLANTGRASLIVDGNLALGVSVHPGVTDPQGKAVDWQAAYGAGQPAFQALSPGGILTEIVCLNCGARNPFDAPIELTGTYTVQLAYSCPSAAGQANIFPNAVPLAQTLTAAAIHFQITQATLVFTAQPTQPVFQVGDPVTFDFQLKNGTSQTVLTAYDLSLGDAVRLRVIDENGKEVAWRGVANEPTPMLSIVSAGNSIDSVHPITPTDLFGTIVAGCDIRQPGTYTAYAIYMIPETFNFLQAYTGALPILIVPGPLAAPPVKFTVARAPASAGAE